jgi:subtilisin
MRPPLLRAMALVALGLVVLLILPTVATSGSAPARVIVVLEAPEASNAVKQGVNGLGGTHIKDLPSVNAAAFYLPAAAAPEAVAALPGVASVEPDLQVTTLAKPAPKPPAQTLPWGVDRIEADLVWSKYTADPVKVAVVDTGIDTSHPDLSANLKGGMSALINTKSYNDDNGHGTHVAGTIAAINNTIGVVGVAPAADLYAVKVLDRRGSGYLSDIIKGLEWAVANDMQVVNMSLGTSSYSSTFEAAVRQTVAAGVVVVAAAGNSGPGENTVNYPAKFEGVIAVSATDSSNTLASFSSRGPEVDLAAPGVSIYSTYKGQTYSTLSGTSMASPHLAGVAALVLTTAVGGDDRDEDGVWDPAEVELRLTRTAQDLGAKGNDFLYGSGLVRADSAVGLTP